MTDVVRVGHLSDTHFLEPGGTPEGTHAYDTSAAFDAVLQHLGDGGDLDLIVVTGDGADHGRPEQYDIAMESFERLPASVHVCPGNHDFDAPLRSSVWDVDVHLPRSAQHGDWTFVYADSNAGRMVIGDDGGLVDPEGEHRLHGNGSLGVNEAEWLRSAVAERDTDHVFVWLHHPPASDVPLAADTDYTAEWLALIDDLPAVRGFGAGHTHVPSSYSFAGRPVFVAPSLKNNFDLTANTWLPPGYRTYGFHPDGTITSDLHLVDDERWPRQPFGRTLRSLFMGEITYDDLVRIIADRSRHAGGAD
jgi:3',5'-cyclic AMP phosphodiesterase CpdA